MNKKNSVMALKSGIWYTVANFLLKGLSFISTPIFSRLLTKTEYGAFSNYSSWLSILSIVITLNVGASLVSARFDYKEKFDEFVFSALILSLIAISSFGIIAVLNSALVESIFEMNQTCVAFMFIYIFFYAAIDLFQTSERFQYKYRISVAISVLLSILNILFSVTLVLNSSDKYFARILGSTIPTVILGAILFVLLWKKGKKIDFTCWKYIIPICLPYIPHALSLTLLNSMDRVMITRYCGTEFTALYSVAYSCGAIVTILSTSLNTAYSPWLGDKLIENKYIDIKKFSYKYILVFCGMLVGIILLIPEVLLVLGGKNYYEAIYVLAPVAAGCGLQFIYTMFVNVEQFKKKTFGMSLASVSAALVNYLLNFYFLNKYGYLAAAYTTLVSYFWLLIVHMYLVKKIGLSVVYDYKFILIIIGCLFMISILANWLYVHSIIRYIIIFIYLMCCAIIVLINRKKIKLLLKQVSA
jgi:O-antigen/teichoic acid export membrane protein